MLVETHAWARLPEDFHSNIERGYVVIQEANPRGFWVWWVSGPRPCFFPSVEFVPHTHVDHLLADGKRGYLTSMQGGRASCSLAQLRDTLPTDLISGELCVRDLEPWAQEITA